MPTPPDVRTFQAARCKAAKPSWVFWRERLITPKRRLQRGHSPAEYRRLHPTADARSPCDPPARPQSALWLLLDFPCPPTLGATTRRLPLRLYSWSTFASPQASFGRVCTVVPCCSLECPAPPPFTEPYSALLFRHMPPHDFHDARKQLRRYLRSPSSWLDAQRFHMSVQKLCRDILRENVAAELFSPKTFW